MGRPAIRSYSASFLVRLTDEEKALLERARWIEEGKRLASGKRLPFNEWVRETLLEAAERAVRKAEK